MADKSVLADSIAFLPHLAAFDLMVKDRMSELQLDKLLMYVIDTVDAVALPYLAEQFDVLGYKGLRLCTTEADVRTLIKNAIELHRYKGTVWAVQQALVSIGYQNVIITEHVGHWAGFSLTLDASTTITTDTNTDIRAMVDEYKNVRSHLTDIFFNMTVNDTLTVVNDDVLITETLIVNDAVRLTGSLKYDGTGKYDGTHDYSGDSDTILIT